MRSFIGPVLGCCGGHEMDPVVFSEGVETVPNRLILSGGLKRTASKHRLIEICDLDLESVSFFWCLCFKSRCVNCDFLKLAETVGSVDANSDDPDRISQSESWLMFD